MTGSKASIRPSGRTPALFQFRLWNLTLLVLFVAIAIVEIQGQRRSEPDLIALAAAGFVLYGLIVWLGWHFIRRLESRLGSMPTLIIYVVTMGVIYLGATMVYVVAEYAYINGGIPRFFL
jgi:Kef-type K+ transport system membrane component KefB